METSPRGFLNCRIAVRKGEQISKHWESLGYTTSLENSRDLVRKIRKEGRILEKTFIVCGLSEAFNKGMSLEDAMFHGRWRSIDTPQVYCQLNRRKRLKLAKYVD